MEALAPRREYSKTSASQIETYRSCNRKWMWKSVFRIPEPSGPAAEKGKRVHAGGEKYLKGWKLPVLSKPDEQAILATLLQALPKPDPRYLVEFEIGMPTYEGGPAVVGFVDLLDPEHDDEEGWLPIIQDQKTRSDLRYAKKPQELLKDVQMVTYAMWVFLNNPDLDRVMLRHLYVCTKGKGRGKNKKFATMTVEVVARRAEIEAEWDKILVDVSTMQAWVEKNLPDAMPVPANITACSMYGGCPYKSLCGFGKDASAGKLTGSFGKKSLPVINTTAEVLTQKKEDDTMGTLEEKLAAKRNGTATPPPAAAKGGTVTALPARRPAPAAAAPAAKPAATLGARKAPALNPPDAPPLRKSAAPPIEVESDDMGALAEEETEEVEETPPPPARRTTASTLAKKAQAAAALAEEAEAEDAVEEEVEEAPVPARPAPRATRTVPAPAVAASPQLAAFTLYIHCLPIKGEEYVLYEDLFAPIGEQVAEDLGIANYLMQDFGKWRGPAANYLRQMVAAMEEPAKAIVISSMTAASDLGIEILAAYASKIIRKA